ncbi:secreted protein [Candidatus Desulfofervidus auxilii]|uniref:Secreted protein n=1 Tax=Desulfofervidus auxilii TaxID=1621989 RepID=A0A7U4QJR1_DESA2|nr:hypothetical protein [Candidatus Desulfofervidus auxilii]AMM40609.1 secreted protein [Candidatus Desulfofervidus auxilii]
MKLSKVLVVLSLVMGLVFMAGNVKAANSMSDNVPGNASFAYFYATPGCISTVIQIHNISDEDQCIHIVPFDRCSIPGYDYQFCVSERGTLILIIDATSDGYGTITPICDEEQMDTKEMGISGLSDGTIIGYMFISAIESEGCKAGEICTCNSPDIDNLVGNNPLIVSTALVQSTWWVAANAAMVQNLTDGEVNTEGYIDSGTDILNGACVNLYGRWYDDTTTNGNLVLVFPVGAVACTESCDDSACGTGDGYYITGYSYDEDQHPTSFHKCVEEANMIPFGAIGLPTGGATSGWIEIDNTTATAFGFTIMEDGVRCDALPLFKEGTTGQEAGCPACRLPSGG